MDFLLLVHQDAPETAPRAWVKSIYNQYPKRRAIHVNHNIQNTTNDWVAQTIVRAHDNIFLAVAGHDCASNGEVYWTTKSPSGYTQHIARTDYQCRSNGGAIVRYYTFKPNEDKICAFTYNITEKAYETDASSQFCFDYDMEPATTSYSLTLGNAKGGTITTDQGTTLQFKGGTKITLTATPDNGYEFAGWGGDLSGTTNPQTITINADMNITASFNPATSIAKIKQYVNDMPALLSGSLDISSLKNVKTVGLYDMKGRICFHQKLRTGQTSVDFGSLKQGWYVISLISDEIIIRKSIMKSH